MEKSDMLECLINYYADGNKAKFSAQIGVKPQTVSAWISRNTFDAETLYAKCANISADWLLSYGEGDMIKTNNSATVNGDGSVAVSGNNNSNVVAGGDSTALLQERIKHLEELLVEKERLIKVYERMMEERK